MKEKQAIQALSQEMHIAYRDSRGFWVDLDCFKPLVHEGEPGLLIHDEVFVVASDGNYHLMLGDPKGHSIEIARTPFNQLQAFMLVLFSFFSARSDYSSKGKFPFKIIEQ